MVDGVDSSLLISVSGHLISSLVVEFLLLCWAGLPSMSMAGCPTVLREAIVGQRPLPAQDGNTTHNRQRATDNGQQAKRPRWAAGDRREGTRKGPWDGIWAGSGRNHF